MIFTISGTSRSGANSTTEAEDCVSVVVVGEDMLVVGGKEADRVTWVCYEVRPGIRWDFYTAEILQSNPLEVDHPQALESFAMSVKWSVRGIAGIRGFMHHDLKSILRRQVTRRQCLPWCRTLRTDNEIDSFTTIIFKKFAEHLYAQKIQPRERRRRDPEASSNLIAKLSCSVRGRVYNFGRQLGETGVTGSKIAPLVLGHSWPMPSCSTFYRDGNVARHA